MIHGDAADLQQLQAAMSEIDKEFDQARQKLRDMNWNAIASLQDASPSD